jgi:hypothetical protein
MGKRPLHTCLNLVAPATWGLWQREASRVRSERDEGCLAVCGGYSCTSTMKGRPGREVSSVIMLTSSAGVRQDDEEGRRVRVLRCNLTSLGGGFGYQARYRVVHVGTAAGDWGVARSGVPSRGGAKRPAVPRTNAVTQPTRPTLCVLGLGGGVRPPAAGLRQRLR